MNSHKTAIAYTRVASPENAIENFQNQIQVIRDFARQQDMEITEIYQDQAPSSGERWAFSKMIRAIKFGEIKPDYIYISDWSRFSRDPAQLHAFCNELNEFDVKIISVSPPHELPTPTAVMYMRVGSEKQLKEL